eukprot:CAMPEP_0197837240 /NCGR_PEP_ID=MMETSP1437-20131217/31559_1 /TAXON_ID=49252 ORGANISM="Eucampia antarctica, Strain CCMP1452" /NCGR_SAMPLE_ID=MMETSP1437 /ASSEMBLY_ACC=CAM_ASM_001096 /LENGTH=261 /DNA_ID=CAMNT_0043444121 /DNA_START=253 /DNA_END=1038 /DNA_ORIENTATION=+
MRSSSDLQMSVLGGACRAYNLALRTYPLLTNSLTSSLLCGCGDILAQVKGYRSRQDTGRISWRKSFKSVDKMRLLRFAAKGLIGGLIWAMWYDASELILQHFERGYLFATFANLSTAGRTVLRTSILLLLEQFLCCPIIFGLWDLPIATVLNGAPLRRIPFEIRTKLGDMLVENAKLWTVANVIVYNVPVHFRTGLSSVFDIWWESIVSEFAADCGKDEDCSIELVDQSLMPVQYSASDNTPAAVFIISNSTDVSYSDDLN